MSAMPCKFLGYFFQLSFNQWSIVANVTGKYGLTNLEDFAPAGIVEQGKMGRFRKRAKSTCWLFSLVVENSALGWPFLSLA